MESGWHADKYSRIVDFVLDSFGAKTVGHSPTKCPTLKKCTSSWLAAFCAAPNQAIDVTRWGAPFTIAKLAYD